MKSLQTVIKLIITMLSRRKKINKCNNINKKKKKCNNIKDFQKF